jgi:predicted amidohydrolase YtcJ
MSDIPNEKSADFIFLNGDIITVDDVCPEAEALTVTNGRIAAVGTRNEVLKKKGPATQVVDLLGKTLMPGFIEPHTHYVLSAFYYDWIDVSGFTYSRGSEVMDRLRKAANDKNPGEWITAFGYDPIQLRDLEGLNADILDEISTTNPIFIMLQSMHSQFVNHKAIELAGITDETPQPSAGEYVKDANGRLTGMLTEQAQIPFMRFITQDNQENESRLIENQIYRYASVGYTTVADLGAYPLLPNWEKITEDFIANDDCPIRLTVMEMASQLELGRRIDFAVSGDRLHAGGAKIWYDGSFPTGNVFLETPYLNSELMQDKLGIPHDTCGSTIMRKDSLKQLVRKYHDQGRQVAIHTHGDRGIRDILDVYEAVLEASPREDHRHRIEHCGLFPINEMDRAFRLGLAPSWHIKYIYYYGEALRDEIIGPERANVFMPMAAAYQAGLRSSLHNDSPMFPSDPLILMQTAVTRKTRNGEVIGDDQGITINEAIKAVTIDAAYQLFLDDKIGSLEIGKLADLVVLSDNPQKVDPNRLDKIKIIETYREGRCFRVSE